MNQLTVDREKCTKCGTCVRICPAGIVRFGRDGFPEIAENQSIRCMECSQCVLFCPRYADTLSFMESAKTVKCADLKLPDAEAAENFLKSRRSIRKFKQEAIPHETFLRIFETVKQAPSAVNRQPVRWIVTEDPEKTKEIANLVLCYFREEIFKNPTSPVSIIGAGLISKAKSGEDGVLRGAPHLVSAVVSKDHAWPEDASIALTYLELAAHALGIGCCWGGFVTRAVRNFAPLREFLGVSDDEYYCGAQMMGIPLMRPLRQFAPRREADVRWL